MTCKFAAVPGFSRTESGLLKPGTIVFERRNGLLYLADDMEPLPIGKETELLGWGDDDGPAIDFGSVVIPIEHWRALFCY